MQYPLISEYVRAIQDASSNLDKLAYLVPVLDDHGEPYRSSGAFAVVFKMKDEQTGKYYALKCFTEEQKGRAEAYLMIADELECVDSPYITSVKYLEKEIFVDSSCEEDEFPVLLMDWIDGETMETYIAKNYQDNYAMAMLCYRFCKMSAWLRSQPFAHGDIKPDNVMVRPDGSLTLVDYDGMFVPAMKGQQSPTIGTKDFSHPQRTVDDFDESIDDFALASIALSLKAISLKPSLLDEYGAADRLLFSAEDYRDLSKSKVMSALQELMDNEEVNTLLSLFLLANAKGNLGMCSFRLFGIVKPLLSICDFSTKVTEEDLENGIADESGFIYSVDGLRLLGNYDTQEIYNYVVPWNKVRQGTKVICDDACYECGLETIDIPQTVIAIGKGAFSANRFECINIPSSVISIGAYAFSSCSFLKKIELPITLESIPDGLFRWCSLEKINIPNHVKSLGSFAFAENAFVSLELPCFVKTIGKGCFFKCEELAKLNLSGVENIADDAFRDCKSLKTIVLPKTMKMLEGNPFKGCNLKIVCETDCFVFEDGILYDKAKTRVIYSNTNLSVLLLPPTVITIEDSAFENSPCIEELKITSKLRSIGSKAFCNCMKLRHIEIPKNSNLRSIGSEAFYNCINLHYVTLDFCCSISQIAEGTFAGCKSLEGISMPLKVTHIGERAFAGCENLKRIKMNNVTNVGFGAFEGCRQIEEKQKLELIKKYGMNIFSDFLDIFSLSDIIVF